MTNHIESACVGFLPSNPDELRVSKNGKDWLTFNIGVGDGDNVQWAKIVVFGEAAQKLSQRLKKGSRVYIEGKISLNEWIGKDQAQHHGLKIIATSVQPLFQIGKKRPPKPKSAGRSMPPGQSYKRDPSLDDSVPW